MGVRPEERREAILSRREGDCFRRDHGGAGEPLWEWWRLEAPFPWPGQDLGVCLSVCGRGPGSSCPTFPRTCKAACGQLVCMPSLVINSGGEERVRSSGSRDRTQKPREELIVQRPAEHPQETGFMLLALGEGLGAELWSWGTRLHWFRPQHSWGMRPVG